MNPLNRRIFVKTIGIAGSLALLFFNSCKKALNRPASYALLENQKELLGIVHEHLFPTEKDRPGAQSINSVKYVSKLLKDPQVEDYNKRLLLYGLNWTEETSQDMYKKSFALLSSEEKEEVLLNLGSFNNGEQWISKNITYILEALLIDPIYGGNTNQSGWNWLKHQPGYPRPDIRTKYQYL